LAFSADGETLAVGSQDGANLWGVKSGKPLPPVRWHFGPVRAVAYSGDGRWFASGGLDRSVQLVDLASGSRIREFRGDASITGVAFSPDSQHVAAISSKGPSLYHWELASKEGRTFTGHNKPVMGIAYHPAGNRVATASWDGTVRLWEPGDPTVESRVIDFGHPSLCNAVSFSPSGRHLAVGLGNGTIAILRTPAR
jgi:WD40 repeat protein